MEILYFAVPAVVGGLVGFWLASKKLKKKKESK